MFVGVVIENNYQFEAATSPVLFPPHYIQGYIKHYHLFD